MVSLFTPTRGLCAAVSPKNSLSCKQLNKVKYVDLAGCDYRDITSIRYGATIDICSSSVLVFWCVS